MTERPLGVADLRGHDGCLTECHPNIWFWCRQHEQSAQNGIKCNDHGWPTTWFSFDDCIRIGPFMSEREANRLARGSSEFNPVDPLGMEVES